MKVTSLLKLCELATACNLEFVVDAKGKGRGKLTVRYPSLELKAAWEPVLSYYGPRLARIAQPFYDAMAIEEGRIKDKDLDAKSRRAALALLKHPRDRWGNLWRERLLNG